MKSKNARILTLAISAAVLSIGTGHSEAQTYTPVPVSISKEKIRGSDGKIYYSHVVLEKQTLYSIAKAYGVTADEICNANKELDIRTNGLKKNSIILIPESGEVQQQKAEDKKVHVVKWYEDIDDIASMYSVSKEALMKYNGLTDSKLKKRQKLLIPSAEEAARLDAEQSAQENVAAQKPASADISSSDNPDKGKHSSDRQDSAYSWTSMFPSKVCAVLMLPLNASSSPNESHLDFYSGVLMAVKDLGDKGISTDLSVYDVGNGTIPVTADRMRQSDFSIGPVNEAGISKALALSPESTYIISPLDHKTERLAYLHSNMVQAPASTATQYKNLLNWLKSERETGDRVLVISEKGAAGTGAVMLMDSLIRVSGIPFTSYSYSILQGRNVSSALSQIMTSSGINRVIVNSESEAFVNDAVRNLNMMLYRKYSVILYSPSKIRSFETIDAENLHSLNTRVSTSYFIDYANSDVRRFLLEYRALYGTEPTQFAFQGYDLAYFMISMKHRYGRNWMEHVAESGRMELLQTDFKFRQLEDGGFVNDGVRRIIYEPDWSIRTVHQQ